MNKPKILYVQDAMCGWCYAFGRVIDDLRIKYDDYFDFIAISGGMMVGDKIKPISAMQDFLKTGIPQVEKYTGAKFGEKYLDLIKEGSYINNSIKPAIALSAFKSMDIMRSVEFAHDMQHEHFYNGKSLNEKEVYLELAANYNIDANELLQRMNNEEFHKQAARDFDFVKNLKIEGFPCVLGHTQKGIYMLTKGYIHEEEMDNILQAFKSTIEQGEQEVSVNDNQNENT